MFGTKIHIVERETERERERIYGIELKLDLWQQWKKMKMKTVTNRARKNYFRVERGSDFQNDVI